LKSDPSSASTRKNRALTLLRKGAWAVGWDEYEWRWRIPGVVPPPAPAWDGTFLHGRTILLHAEQGLGDSVQFIRYAALVKGRRGRVLLQCPTVLAKLLATCTGVDRVLSPGDARPPIDCHAPLLSLPRLFGTDLDSVPAPIPYFTVDPERRAHWSQKLSGKTGFKVGLAWQGNPSYDGDRRRSIPLSLMKPLTNVPGVCFYSLQRKPGAEQLCGDLAQTIAELGADEWSDFAETAAVLANLNLVISVDSAVAHLAGALGVPVWVALPEASDWRWLTNRDDTPWYPSMRLFRQRRTGGWDDVFQRMSKALQRTSGGKNLTPQGPKR
jgi:hypothetical protein